MKLLGEFLQSMLPGEQHKLEEGVRLHLSRFVRNWSQILLVVCMWGGEKEKLKLRLGNADELWQIWLEIFIAFQSTTTVSQTESVNMLYEAEGIGQDDKRREGFRSENPLQECNVRTLTWGCISLQLAAYTGNNLDAKSRNFRHSCHNEKQGF